GYGPAQMRLAALFTEGGVGVEADPVQARDWTRRAAESGEPRAMQHYATQLYDGVGGAADEAGALEWMRKAAEAGRVDAQYNLAHLYENGIKGMRADKVEAFTWYMIAARRGDQQALEAVQRLTPSLSAAQRDRARAGADAFNVAPVNG
ncbi:tetratricopeptide repeat protein, partial [Brevundimonas sp.]|uniref:tetratricopeptide repeat protein n=1 Tax=Brevundimonas sp. TaxID=1871086 RepID=UPI0028A58C23